MNKKYRVKISLLATLVGMVALAGTSAHAQEAASSELSSESAPLMHSQEVAAGVEAGVGAIEVSRPTVTSGMSTDQQKKMSEFMSQHQEINDLAHQIKVMELQASLEKFRLEKVKAEKEMEDVINGVTDEKSEGPDMAQANPFAPAFQNPMPMMPVAETPKEPEKPKEPLDGVYITKIYGLDDDLGVTVYFDNAIINAKVGDVIGKGIKLVGIGKGKATFAHKGKRKEVSLTTGFNAYQNAFDQPKKEDDKGGQMQGGMPMMGQPVYGGF